jgi:hypothetical protein
LIKIIWVNPPAKKNRAIGLCKEAVAVPVVVPVKEDCNKAPKAVILLMMMISMKTMTDYLKMR